MNTEILCGALQGSILEPKLFIIYINEICNISKRLKSILFADDKFFFFWIEYLCVKVLVLIIVNERFCVNKKS